MGYDVVVLKVGYYTEENSSTSKADGTVTLVKGSPHNIIVDTGLPSDRDIIINLLADNGFTPDDIDIVIGTHGHSDHIGNLNLFGKAKFIVGFDICFGDLYEQNQLKQGCPYKINDFVEVLPTPGHTCEDISVIVKTSQGIIVVAGDLFECEEDLEDPAIWQSNSCQPVLQEINRQKVLSMADYIIPGHGPMFKVPAEIKEN